MRIHLTPHFAQYLDGNDWDRLRALTGTGTIAGFAASRRGPFTLRITRWVDAKVTGTIVGCGSTPQEAIRRAMAKEAV